MLVRAHVYVCVLRHIRANPIFATVYVVVAPDLVFASASCGCVAQPV